MRTPSFLLVAAGLATLAGCTVKNTEAPALSGPSTLATSITMTASKDSIIQNGLDSTAIAIQALGPDGQSKSVTLRAEIFVDGVIQDFGTLSNKAPVTPTTITYFAPAAPIESVGTGTRVTIAVTPVGGDFGGEVRRYIEINVIPPGVILPPNGAPVPSFTVTPTPANTRKVLNFDASATTDEGVACGSRCSYAWNFGDSTTGTGLTTTHEYRSAATYTVALTVTDERGTSATATQSLVVAATAPPTAIFRISPTPVGVNQQAFFNASESRPTAGRQIVSYAWNFGEGSTGSGVTVSHSYSALGSYSIVLTVTDDSDAVGQATQTLSVATAGAGPTAVLTFSPTAPKAGNAVFFNASGSTPGTAPISTYRFNYGDGTPDDVGTVSTQSHTFALVGGVATSYNVRLTVTDALGRTGTVVVSVPVTP